MQGIENNGDHWIWFSDEGPQPGRFADAEAARWGCWIKPDVALHINEGEGRLITVDDTRAAIRAHPSHLVAAQSRDEGSARC